MIKTIISIFICLSSMEIFAEGFVRGTLVLTANGMQCIEAVKKEDLIVSGHGIVVPIVQVSQCVIDTYVEVSVGEECICCHELQQLFSADRHAFIHAHDLYAGEQLLTFDGVVVSIDFIERIKKEAVVYGLSVPYPHYMWIGKHKILAHNIAPAIGVGIVFAVEAGVFEFVSASFFAGIATVGGIVLGSHFSKKTNKAIECKPGIGIETPSGPVFPGQNNDDDKDKEKHPNGKYKDDGNYHKEKQNGNKSPRPEDGQGALDRSVPVEGSTQRVAIEGSKIVVLKKTIEGIYHGYTVSWEQLEKVGKASRKIMKALRKNNLVTASGKIIK